MVVTQLPYKIYIVLVIALTYYICSYGDAYGDVRGAQWPIV